MAGHSDICDIFACRFEEAYTISTTDENIITNALINTPNDVIDLNLTNISQEAVLTVLKAVKPKASSGPDGIPPSYSADAVSPLRRSSPKKLISQCN